MYNHGLMFTFKKKKKLIPSQLIDHIFVNLTFIIDF